MSGIAGYSYGTIENCTNNADVTALNNHVGGITGRCQSADGIFINCHNTGSVSGGAYVGGIAGSCLGDVTNCTNTGDVTGSAQYGVGGIIGITSDASSVSVTGCYNTGDITSTTTGYAWVGGIVGSFPNQNARGSIENCYNTGAVSATAEGSVCSGGILGGGYGDITNCYNTGTVTGSVNVGAVGGFVNGTVEKAYYLTGSAAAGIGLASVAAIATERTAEQMTGPNALDETNMNLDSDIWTAGGEDTWEYLGENEDGLGDYGFMAKLPQLTVFLDAGSGHEEILVQTVTGLQQETVGGEMYYRIYDAGQLKIFRNIVNNTNLSDGEKNIYGEEGHAGANGRLMADIDLNPGVTFNADGTYTENTTPEQWTPISNTNRRYTGTFDGNGHTVSGVYINNSSINQGLFGYVFEDGTIQNLGVINSYIRADERVGGIVGYMAGSLTNSYNTGSVSNGARATVGGVAGCIYHSTVQNCYNTSSVSNSDYAGGVVGEVRECTVTNCYYLEGTAETGIGVDDSGDGEATALTIAQIEDTGTDGLLAKLSARRRKKIPGTPPFPPWAPGNTATTEGASINYTVQNASQQDVALNATVLAVDPQISNSGSAALSFIAPSDTAVTYAGTYEGYVTFTVSIGDADTSASGGDKGEPGPTDPGEVTLPEIP